MTPLLSLKMGVHWEACSGYVSWSVERVAPAVPYELRMRSYRRLSKDDQQCVGSGTSLGSSRGKSEWIARLEV